MNFKKILIALAILSLATGFISSAAAVKSAPANAFPSDLNGKPGLDSLATWIGTHYTYSNVVLDAATPVKFNNSLVTNGQPKFYGNLNNAAQLVYNVLRFNRYSVDGGPVPGPVPRRQLPGERGTHSITENFVDVNGNPVPGVTLHDHDVVTVHLNEDGGQEYVIDPYKAFKNPFVLNPTTNWYI